METGSDLVTNADLAHAQAELRRLMGGHEPYAADVMPMARAIAAARIREQLRWAGALEGFLKTAQHPEFREYVTEAFGEFLGSLQDTIAKLKEPPVSRTEAPEPAVPRWAHALAESWREVARIARRNGHHGSAKKHEAFAEELIDAAKGKA